MSKKFREKIVYPVGQPYGNAESPGATEVTVLEKDNGGDVLRASGTTVPGNGEAGYAKGCIFIDTDVGAGTSGIYDNVGTTAAANFDLIGLGGGVGGSPAYDDIASPDANSTIAFLGFTNTWTSTLDTGSFFTMSATDSALAGQTNILDLKHADDGEANGIFLRCLDNSGADVKFTIGKNGSVIIEGEALGTDALTINLGDLTISSGDLSVSGSFAPGVVVVGTRLDLGTDGVGVDMNFYTTTAGDQLLWDASEKTLLATDSKIHMQDADEIHFGAGSGTGTGDFKLSSNGTDLLIVANDAVVAQALKIGGNTNTVDIEWLGTTAGAEVLFDASADEVTFDGIDLRLNDDDFIIFGDDGDFTLRLSAANLELLAGADVGSQTFQLGNATNDVDLLLTGDTAGDSWLFDAGSDQVTMTDIAQVITESDTGTVSLDITNSATSVNCVEINSDGALTNGLAGLAILSTGALATGGIGLLVDYRTGSPDTAARMVELAGTSKDLIGIYADVDGATEDVYLFHSGGATATGKSVLAVSSDGTPAAAASRIMSVTFTGDDANVPILLQLEGTGNGVDSTGLGMVTESNGTTAWNISLDNAADAALGVSLRTKHDSASPAAADEIFFHTMLGEDDGAAETEYVRVAGQILLETGGAEDGEYVVSVAADNGTLTQALVVGPQLDSANTGISVGSGAGAAAITSEGTQDLILQTNYGTTSSNIVITDGAAGDITFNMDTTGLVEIASVDGGALGAQLTLSQTGGGQAASDVLARILFTGEDDAPATNSYGQIDCVVVASTAGSERGRLDFYAGDPDAGGVIIGLQVDNDGTNGIVSIGDNTAAGILQSVGDNDLTLQTGNSTTGSISIVDGANGDITLAPNGSGEVIPLGQAVAADSMQGYVTTTYRYDWEHTDPDGSNDIVLFNSNSPKIEIIDVWLDMDTAEGGAMTVTLRDAAAGAGNAITSAMDANATGRQASTAIGNGSLAGSSSLVANFSGNPGTATGKIFVTVLRTA